MLISTHTPLAGRDRQLVEVLAELDDFYSHAPCGARLPSRSPSGRWRNFYSHAPCGARLSKNSAKNWAWEFLLTRPLRGATEKHVKAAGQNSHFYSHAPCGARLILPTPMLTPSTFLLTRPLRGATGAAGYFPRRVIDFYSHAPCGARPLVVVRVIEKLLFLLTRPLRGATSTQALPCWVLKISTHTPLAGRDRHFSMYTSLSDISTHTPLAGRDICVIFDLPLSTDFYSHAPCGARHTDLWR